MSMRLARVAIRALGAVGWLTFAFVTWYALAADPERATGGVFQVDWHVFRSGFDQFLSRDLYRAPLDAGGLSLSTPIFNLPPLAAVWAAPLAMLPVDVGGYVWQVVGAGAIALAGVIASRISQVRWPLSAAGLGVGLLSVTLLFVEGLHLGTNNYLMLAIVAIACLLWARGHDRAAGIALGIAIATKLWPVTLLVVAARERRWAVMGWGMGVAGAVTALAFLWLGTDSPADFIRALGTPIPATGYLLGPAALPGLRDLWTMGLGWAVMVALLAIPWRGRGGLGVAIVAGMAPIANLWVHYGPTLIFGIILVASALTDGRRSVGFAGQRPVAKPPPA